MNKNEILSAVHNALDEKELNFNTKMAETFTLVDGVYIPTGAYTAIRDDKVGPEAVISRTAFTKNYVPIQNEDAFSVLGEMADQADVEFQNIGSWGNGAGIFAQISLGDITGIGSSGDTVGKWLSIVNSHDGSRALTMLVTPYRFFCSNQISKAIGEAGKNNRLVSIHHDARGEDRLREVAQALVYAEQVYAETEAEYKRLADTMVTMDQVREVMYRCFPHWSSADMKSQERIDRNFERRLSKAMARFHSADNGRLDELTGWNLYNAVQGTYQHDTKRTRNYERSLLIGNIAANSEMSLNVVKEVIANPTAKTSTAEFDEIFAKVA
jgi:phage/plasmid-like protein (TIGR03299 family)